MSPPIVSGRVSRFDWQGWSQALRGHVNDALRATAHYVPLDVHQRIMVRVRPDDGPQQDNTEAVARRKRRTLGHAIPGLHSGRLSDASAWRVTELPDGWRVSPPVDRAQVLVWLEDEGYEFLGVSTAIEQHLDGELTRALDRAQADIARFTTEVEL